ncbi:MAG: SDR family NAD(P)-dependent oxidoreductase [Leptolyngbya sp. SIO1E4]|nr:SDR family NAD(P)-dependent oxidoreductase [Leptolyngbya sp. SIO1E4]
MKGSHLHNMNGSEIAIVGMSGRFPGAKDIDAFWQNLQDGIESTSFFSDSELTSSGVSPTLLNDPDYVKAKPILSGIELFDAEFFGFSPKEAEMMDPQHRLFLEHAWEALENAGYDPATYESPIGVYAGVDINSYLLNNVYPSFGNVLDLQTLIGNATDYLSTRVSYKLNLKGPSVTIQTACSTSLVSVHMACQSLLSGECDVSLAGGISLTVPQKVGYSYQEGGIASPDGHCRAFDAEAQGTIFGEGVGVVVLKRLTDALADGDCIHAIIKGSAINNDGALKAGYTAPSRDGQSAVISEAQAVAEIDPETITYIETHGTGTALGDPIEIAALTQVFRRSTDKKEFCAIGSVKTNVGHLTTAAGVTSLIKTVLGLKNRLIPPSLHFEEPNPKIDFANSPFYVNTQLTPWETNGTPRRAGVSSFGVGGTNAHVVLEEAPSVEASGPSRPWQLLLLSAKTSSALEAATTNLAQYLDGELNLADVAYTLSVGRRAFNHRRFVVSQGIETAQSALSSLEPGRVGTHLQAPGERPVVFMFSGQGAQYVNMAQELYQSEATFTEQVDICCELLKPHLGLDLRQILYPAAEQFASASEQLRQTAIAQPALFVIEYALAHLWQEWGVRPQAMMGHSIGEYVAATLASVLSLEDALALVAARGKLMQRLPSGSMLAVPLAEQEVIPLLGKELSIAVINGPAACVVSGVTGAVEVLERQLASQGIEGRRLHTSHAFHSPMMEPILESFTQKVKQVRLSAPQIPYLSNVTGTWIRAEEATSPAYWAKHLRQPVQWASGLEALLQEPSQILLEIGPGRTLTTLAKRHPEKVPEQVVLSCIRHPQEADSDVAFLLKTVGQSWLAGVDIDWSGFYAHQRRHRLPLPTYPFERQRYWIDPPKVEEGDRSPSDSVSLEKKSDIADWFYVPAWKQSVPSLPNQGEESTSPQACTVVFIDECGVGSQLVARLRTESQTMITVKIGAEFTHLSENLYVLNPGKSDDYDTLFKDLLIRQKLPEKIIHLWNITAVSKTESGLAGAKKAQETGFYSLLFLAQALGKQTLSKALQLIVVSNGLQSVTGEERLSPEKATLLGAIKVIPQEYAQISCCNIDVVLPSEGSWQQEKLIGQLLAELRRPVAEQLIAYRGHNRWVQTFEPVRLEKLVAEAPRLRKGGVYLITGGLGGIGLVLAQYLAEKVQAKLFLIGRSAFPVREEWEQWLATHEETDRISRKIRKIQDLEALGAKVLVLRADVADLETMQAVVTQAQEQFGAINGVIHAAGVPGGGVIQRKTPEEAQKILNPKVNGTLVLDAVFQQVELDFFVLCSSVASMLGGFGQVDYCGANQFLDAFARYKNSTNDGCCTVSINWDAWQDVGMAVEALKQLEPTSDSPKLQRKVVTHPLFEECLVEGQAQAIYVSKLKVDQHWVLDEHRLMDQATLPGTAYLEMVRAAGADYTQQTLLEIREIYFLKPLTVEEGEDKEVRTLLQDRGNRVEFVVMSQSASGWVEHARGTISSLESEPSAPVAIDELAAHCNRQTLTFAGQKLQIPSDVLKFGERWNNLQWIKQGDHQALALLELPEAYANDLKGYQLHPALLDIATAFFNLGFQDETSVYLPFCYKRLQVRGELPQRIYSYIQVLEESEVSGETLKFNITIFNEAGRKLVEIEEYTLRRISQGQADKGTVDKDTTQQSAIPSENFSLKISRPGRLDTLRFQPAARQHPGPGEVEIEVEATGLNFKEVLFALGLLPIPSDMTFSFGFECAGRVSALGEGVEGFAVGDEVIAFGTSCFSRFMTTPVQLVARKPEHLSLEEAATIPIAFVTAYIALMHFGRLQPGEKVLIHSAAGGVGMAAVQIAQWVGAEIFATAGTPEKREFLRSLGIKHVMDSRSLAFADEVISVTEGAGVDVVLNSLGGEFIPKSLSVLGRYGRFLELGLRDIVNNTPLGLGALEKRLSFFVIQAESELPGFSTFWQAVVQHFQQQDFRPMPHKVFPIGEVSSAFNYMSQGKHIGKIVLSFADKAALEQVLMALAEAPEETAEIMPFSTGSAGWALQQRTATATPSPVEVRAGWLSPSEGVDVFERIMAGSRFAQVLVSTSDFLTRGEQDSPHEMLSSLKLAENILQPMQATHSRPDLENAYVAPDNEIEQVIAQVWQEVLGIKQIGIHDNFFELGGDSLLATQVISQVNRALHTDLSASNMFEAPTVACIFEQVKNIGLITQGSQTSKAAALDELEEGVL